MSVMQVPRTIAPGLTLGAALSNRTHERPCASFPVTTRRIGFGVSVMLVSPLSLTLAEHCPTWGEARPPRNIHQKLRGGKNPWCTSGTERDDRAGCSRAIQYLSRQYVSR